MGRPGHLLRHVRECEACGAHCSFILQPTLSSWRTVLLPADHGDDERWDERIRSRERRARARVGEVLGTLVSSSFNRRAMLKQRTARLPTDRDHCQAQAHLLQKSVPRVADPAREVGRVADLLHRLQHHVARIAFPRFLSAYWRRLRCALPAQAWESLEAEIVQMNSISLPSPRAMSSTTRHISAPNHQEQDRASPSSVSSTPFSNGLSSSSSSPVFSSSVDDS